MQNLKNKSTELRLAIIELSKKTKTPHIGSCLSCSDILLAAYSGGLNIHPQNVKDDARDRLVFSKGHCATALVCALAQHGFYQMEDLYKCFNQNGGLQEHPNLQYIPGVEVSAGSLGHGLPIGVGMAMASRISDTPYRVCVVMGDGECNEGSVWEAAMLAGRQKLANLCVVVDFNRWQATGRSCEITYLEPLAQKWQAFGFEVVECDGHDADNLSSLLANFGSGSKPLAIVAHTTKGKGVSIMEDDNNWHYRIPNEEEMAIVYKELQI